MPQGYKYYIQVLGEGTEGKGSTREVGKGETENIFVTKHAKVTTFRILSQQSWCIWRSEGMQGNPYILIRVIVF